MDNENSSLVEQKTGDKRNLTNGQEQGNNVNMQSLHVAPWNPIMNTGLNLAQESAIRLTSVHGYGNRFSLPQTSVNRAVSNDRGLMILNCAGITLPQISAVPVANLNSARIRLTNLNNAGVAALPNASQAIMVTATPPLTTQSSDRFSGSIVSQQVNVATGSCTSRQEMLRNSSKDICKERVSLGKQKTSTHNQDYSELSTSTEMEESEQPNTDFSQFSDNKAVNGTPTRSNSTGTNFPSKLHEILSRNDITDIISWSPHGRSWKVHKPKVFEERIIPQYFRHSKYYSFTRQVNGWGFHRITQGPDHNAYYHELFLRGLPHLCNHMRRQSAAVHGRNDTCSRADPDFYRISEVSPLPEISYASAQESTRTSPQQASQQNCAPEEEDENRKPSSTSHIDNGAASVHKLENSLALSQGPFNQIGLNLQQQLLQTQLIHPMTTWPILIDSNVAQQCLLVPQAMGNDPLGRSMYNVGLRNINPVSVSVVDPVIFAQPAANVDRSDANASRHGTLFHSRLY